MQAKLIGQKVAESDAAQELIARIKQVTRRRRLTSPPATGPGVKLDPNLIAEYLDNVLSADHLAEVEETCLASDTHLAEVAASHQILTLVLGEPALVPPTARQRMYGLIRGREAIPNRKASVTPIGQGALEPLAANDEADETLLLGLSLSRPGSWTRWLLPVMSACLLVAAGLAIWRAVLPGVQTMVPPKNPSGEPMPVMAQANQKQGREQVAQVSNKVEPEPPVTPDKKNDQEKKDTAVAQKTDAEIKAVKTPEKSEEPVKKSPANGGSKPAPKPPAVQPPRTDRRDIARMTLVP